MIVKKLTAHQIIEISKHKPMNTFKQAEEIARVFHDQKLVYVPKGEFFLNFMKMISAIWYGGYIAGVQAERKRRSRRTNKAEPDAKAS